MVRARAGENHIFLAACNRVGTEQGVPFIGFSGIYGVNGEILQKAGPDVEVIIADCDLPTARDKHVVKIPGQYELPTFACRKPDLYDAIVD
jgi:predicted amidohydrolase